MLRIVLLFILAFPYSNHLIAENNNPDPWEGFNRKVFAFNEYVDKTTLKPAARAYKAIAPEPIEYMTNNFFGNLGDFTTAANDLLQFDLKQAANDGGRFIINSTLGLGGLLDVASAMGLEKHREDFGLTLASWGVKSGPYLVLPFQGPSTIRGSVGRAVDGGVISIVPNQINDTQTNVALFAYGTVNTRANLLDAEKIVSGDRYLFIRDAYLSRVDTQVNGIEADDGFGSDGFDDDF